MNIPEEIYIHILKITTFKTSDLKSLKLSCRFFNTIVNERIVLLITSIAKWKSQNCTHEKIYSAKRIILVLTLADYVSNEEVAFVERLVNRRLKGLIKFTVWFTDVEKAITLHNCKQEPCEHAHANLEKLDYLQCNNYVLHNQCCVDHHSYTNLLSFMYNSCSPKYCKIHNVPVIHNLTTLKLNVCLKTKCELMSLFKGNCWNNSRVITTRDHNNLIAKKKLFGFTVFWNCKNQLNLPKEWKKNTSANVANSRLQDR